MCNLYSFITFFKINEYVSTVYWLSGSDLLDLVYIHIQD